MTRDLAAKGLIVCWQNAFRHDLGATTLLRLLHDYIRECDVVLCFHGMRSGACPPPATTAPFQAMLPPQMAQASFMQWEFFFALYYNKPVFQFRSHNRFQPSRSDGVDVPGLQQQFLNFIDHEIGSLIQFFGDVTELRLLVMKVEWPRRTGILSRGLFSLSSKIWSSIQRYFSRRDATTITFGRPT